MIDERRLTQRRPHPRSEPGDEASRAPVVEDQAADHIDGDHAGRQAVVAYLLGASADRAGGARRNDEQDVDPALQRRRHLVDRRVVMGLRAPAVGVLVGLERVRDLVEESLDSVEAGLELPRGRIGLRHDVDLGPVGPQNAQRRFCSAVRESATQMKRNPW